MKYPQTVNARYLELHEKEGELSSNVHPKRFEIATSKDKRWRPLVDDHKMMLKLTKEMNSGKLLVLSGA